MASRLFKKYKSEIKPILETEFPKNKTLAAKLEKVIISVGAGETMKDSKLIQNIKGTISLITDQKAIKVIAKKSVAGFKVREGMSVGVKATLRGEQMYHFLNKLYNVALPGVKDFRGLSKNGFGGRGNFNFGLDERLMFPEAAYDNIIKTHGMNISIATSTTNDAEAYRLLELVGIPFTKGRA